MTVAVITDSSASLPAELVGELGISVVPLRLDIGGEDMADGDLPLEDVLARLDEGITTSAPSPGAWAEAFEVVGGPAVALTVASTMSASCQSAIVAARLIDADIRVVDTRTAAGAQGLVALAAAAAARAGASVDEVEAEARKVADRVHLAATLDDLSHLVRSGRVPAIAGWAGRQLHVNPLFEFRNGEAHPLRPAIGRHGALARLVDMCRSSRPNADARLHVAVIHALEPDDAEAALAALEPGEGAERVTAAFSPVMLVHTGPGLVGLAWWWEE
jgi:DegV family protein with EDD domain